MSESRSRIPVESVPDDFHTVTPAGAEPARRPDRHVELVVVVRDPSTGAAERLAITRVEDGNFVSTDHAFSLGADDLYAAGHAIEQARFAVIQELRHRGLVTEDELAR